MLTSELIHQLQALQEEHGDLQVVILPAWYEVVTGASVQDVALEPDGDDTVQAVVLETSIDIVMTNGRNP